MDLIVQAFCKKKYCFFAVWENNAIQYGKVC